MAEDTRCRLPIVWGAHPRRCLRRRCVGCARVLVREQRHKLGGALGVIGSRLTLATITAPGQDVLPWDLGRCRHAPGEACKHGREHCGLCGCRVRKLYADLWNADAAENWRQLHRLANRRAQRVARQHGVWWGMVAKVWQLQARGLLHAHVVLPWGSPGERAATKAYVAALEDLGPRFDFGNVDNHLRAGPREGPGWRGYLSRYLAKSTWELRELPLHSLYVHPELTRYADCSIRRQRERRRHWAARRRVGPVVRALQAERARLDSERSGSVARQLRLGQSEAGRGGERGGTAARRGGPGAPYWTPRVAAAARQYLALSAPTSRPPPD